MRSSSKSRSQSKIMKIITTPVKFLAKARDYYIKSITEYSNTGMQRSMMIGGFGGGYSSAPSSLPRSFSANTSSSSSYGYRDRHESDHRPNYHRSNSSSRSSEIYSSAELELYIEQHMKQQQQSMGAVKSSPRRMMPRSKSVGMGFMGRIDEEKDSEDF